MCLGCTFYLVLRSYASLGSLVFVFAHNPLFLVMPVSAEKQQLQNVAAARLKELVAAPHGCRTDARLLFRAGARKLVSRGWLATSNWPSAEGAARLLAAEGLGTGDAVADELHAAAVAAAVAEANEADAAEAGAAAAAAPLAAAGEAAAVASATVSLDECTTIVNDFRCHFKLRDTLKAALRRDMGHPQPGILYTYEDFEVCHFFKNHCISL